MLEQRVTVVSDFDSVAIALHTLSAITVHEVSEEHVLAGLPNGAAALARPADDGVEILVADATGVGGHELSALLQRLDFEVSLEAEPCPVIDLPTATAEPAGPAEEPGSLTA